MDRDRPVSLERGAVVLVSLDPTTGHEQQGTRPCIVVSDPEVVGDQRFPMICITPLTATPCEGDLYPLVTQEGSGLRKPSHAMVDQLRSIDKRRVSRWIGRIRDSELEGVDRGLCRYLGLDGSSVGDVP